MNYCEYPKMLQPARGDGDPIIVNSAGEQEGYLARGYIVPGISDPEGYENEIAGALPEKYRPLEYPKWCSGVLVNSQAEEDQLRRSQAAATAVADGAAPRKRA
jgi:hypothetical protein